MLDRIKFVMEMANELNRANFQSVLSCMAEYACAASTNGRHVGDANWLADVVSTTRNHQYSVKTYRDKSIEEHFLKDKEAPYTEWIIERRVSGVSDPNAPAELIITEVIQDIMDNAKRSAVHYGVSETSAVLLGFSECNEYYYFRLSEFDYYYKFPDEAKVAEFTEKNRNFGKHPGNRSKIKGFIDGVCVYEWIHPNNQTFTRCLLKKYDLRDKESFYFKIKKQKYTRPTDVDLMKMVEL